MSEAADSNSGPRFAGIHATGRGVRTAVASIGAVTAENLFPLSLEGLEELIGWLQEQRVTTVALLQGSLSWPWQVERRRQQATVGPLNLAYWLEYEGPDALAHVHSEAAWQPTMLALRDGFTIFVVRPAANGGPYRIAVSRNAARILAVMLADGAFIEEYPKPALSRLIDEMATRASAVAQCLDFFLADSRGHWHNRARAKIARRLKHCDIGEMERRRLVQVIGRRLIDGDFTEQFDDQLRLLIHLDQEVSKTMSVQAMQSSVPYVQRYGKWLADRQSISR